MNQLSFYINSSFTHSKLNKIGLLFFMIKFSVNIFHPKLKGIINCEF